MENQIKTISKSLTKLLKNNEDINGNTELFNKIESLGFEYIGEGLSRMCFSYGKYVVKIEKNGSLRRYQQNKNEVEIYFKIPDKIKEYFIKPLAWDKNYKWLIVKKIKKYSLDIDIFKDTIDFLNDNILSKIKDKDMRNHISTDLGLNNIGLTDNDKVIIIDYGYKGIMEIK